MTASGVGVNSGKGAAMSDETVIEQAVAKGTALGGAVLLVTVGVLEFLQGISAIARDEVLAVGIGYTYNLTGTAWGWIHLVLGALVAAVGAALFTGTAWARVSAMVICAVSVLVNFLWLPHYPLWSVPIIALNAVVIWAVTTWNPDEDAAG